MENGAFAPKEQLQKSKCSIFHNIFKYVIFQRRQKALMWSKVLSSLCTLILQNSSKPSFGISVDPDQIRNLTAFHLLDGVTSFLLMNIQNMCKNICFSPNKIYGKC